MAADRRLARNFTVGELPGYELATEADVDRLEETVARVLQPIRTHFGVPVRITSWMWWSSGEPREGSHAHGGTVDFVVGDGRTREAYEWAATNIVPAGYVGRLIYEPERSRSEGVPQGEHIHLAPRAAMLEAFGDPRIQVLEETAEGEYTFFRVATGIGLGTLALLAGFFFLATRPKAAA